MEKIGLEKNQIEMTGKKIGCIGKMCHCKSYQNRLKESCYGNSSIKLLTQIKGIEKYMDINDVTGKNILETVEFDKKGCNGERLKIDIDTWRGNIVKTKVTREENKVIETKEKTFKPGSGFHCAKEFMLDIMEKNEKLKEETKFEYEKMYQCMECGHIEIGKQESELPMLHIIRPFDGKKCSKNA